MEDTVANLASSPFTVWLSGDEDGIKVEDDDDKVETIDEEVEDPMDTEEEDDSEPLFALYSGGDTSVLAGLGEEAGYYQVAMVCLP